MNSAQQAKLAKIVAERTALGKANFAAAKTHSQSDDVIKRLGQLDAAIEKLRNA